MENEAIANPSIWPLLLTFFTGSFFGTLLGPILLEEYRLWRLSRSWKNPRKKLLEQKLNSAGGEGWIGLDVLARLIGVSDDECRSLLIEINARGGKIAGGREAWALIARQPLQNSDMD